jgi:hypothetical protein
VAAIAAAHFVFVRGVTPPPRVTVAVISVVSWLMEHSSLQLMSLS